MPTVLVVDDKQSLRDSVGFTLQRAGFTVIAADGGEPALAQIARKRPDVVVTDLKMPGMTGLELIEGVRGIDADVPIVLMTAFGTVETAVRAMKLGAFDYITKPFEGDELVIAVKRAIEHARLKRENAALRAAASPAGGSADADGNQPRGLDRVLGQTSAMRELKDRLKAVASSQGTVLISGESGTGKEVVARAIHEMSPRADRPFLAVNCAAMSESLLESELFGHEKGSFTGAEALRKGRFELAHEGSLLLDEISEIKPQIQAKLLRVLQERAFERVGSSTTMGVDVRVIATTNRDLASEVVSGGFRQDLFYRLNVLPLRLPPLRERVEDVAVLVPHFVRGVCAREGKPVKRVSAGAMELLMAYPWPGNVRELQNLCERAVVLTPGEEIGADLVRHWLTGPGAPGRAMKARPKHAMAPGVSEAGYRGVQHGGANGVGTGVSGGMSAGMPGGAANAEGHAGAGQFGSAGMGGGGGLAGPAVAEQSGAMGEGGASRGALPASMLEPRPLAEIEREIIVETLHRFNGHRQKTAKALGIGVRTLGLKLKKWKEENLVEQSL